MLKIITHNSFVPQDDVHPSALEPSLTQPGLALDLREIVRKIENKEPVPILTNLQYDKEPSFDDVDVTELDVKHTNATTLEVHFPHFFDKKENEPNTQETE